MTSDQTAVRPSKMRVTSTTPPSPQPESIQSNRPAVANEKMPTRTHSNTFYYTQARCPRDRPPQYLICRSNVLRFALRTTRGGNYEALSAGLSADPHSKVSNLAIITVRERGKFPSSRRWPWVVNASRPGGAKKRTLFNAFSTRKRIPNSTDVTAVTTAMEGTAHNS